MINTDKIVDLLRGSYYKRPNSLGDQYVVICDILPMEREQIANLIEQQAKDRDILESKIVTAENERDELFSKVKQLESQVAVIQSTVKKSIIGFCYHFYNRKNHSTICYPPDDDICRFYDDCTSVEDVLDVSGKSKAQELQKYAELGRLAESCITEQNVCEGKLQEGCSFCCGWYEFCKLRAEFMGEEKP